MEKTDWFTEYTDTETCKQALGFRLKVKKRLVQDKSAFQKLKLLKHLNSAKFCCSMISL